MSVFDIDKWERSSFIRSKQK